MPEKKIVARVADIPPGSRKVVTVDGRDIAVFNIDGEYFAITNTCPHEGADLSKGVLSGVVESDEPGCYKLSRPGELIKCPWHGWEFDIRTGRSYCDPRKIRVKNFTVEVEIGAHLAEGPYKIETFPIETDENYIVIEA